VSRLALAQRVSRFGTTVFSEFSALAAQHHAVNLGQGFPDFDGPEVIKEAAARAIRDGVNQYAVGSGAPALRRAIAEHTSRFYGLSVDPETMITVTSGATEALFDAVLGLVDPGDEVVLFEPFYDSYAASVEMAGGVVRCVELRPPNALNPAWWFDSAELHAAFSARTKLVILNTPHNPCGKVFTRVELGQIAALCQRHDALVLSDEVYEHLSFQPHVRIATLPGMFERTITVSSSGKSFSLTGWKIGWAIAPPELRAAVQRVHQFVTFATSSPMQAAIAEALALPDSYFAELLELYAAKRDRLLQALDEVGLKPFTPEGTYFAIADAAGFGRSSDDDFCRWLIREVGVAAIPTSVFYRDPAKAAARGLVRFAFCKTDPVLDEAAKRLRSIAS
jgi:N-succinyldiaminopimelate aminotransferase